MIYTLSIVLRFNFYLDQKFTSDCSSSWSLLTFYLLSTASTVAMPNSQVFVFTDATPKDPGKINFITSLITEKKLRVQFLVTGTCQAASGRRRRKGKCLMHSSKIYLLLL